MMKKNKEYLLKELIQKTNRSKQESILISEILDSHFIIGRKNKEKIINDFIEKLNISVEEANKLYNICSELIVKGIFKN